MPIPYALLLNDIHVSKDNIEEFEKNWKEALDICKSRSIHRIILGGDLFQSRSSQPLNVLLSVREAILLATDKYGLDLILAYGNHDIVDQEDCQSYCHVFASYPKVTVVDTTAAMGLSNSLNFVVMSYFPENTTFTAHLERLAACGRKDTILYIHEGISGAIATASDKELPASLFKGYKKVLVGHYHNRCKVHPNIEYIGASRQHNFGEDEEKGYTILYDDGSTEFVKNTVNTRYKTLEVPYERIGELSEQMVSSAIENGYKLKVKLSCTPDEAKSVDTKKLAALGIAKVEITQQTDVIESSDTALEARFDKAQIKQEYKNFCESKEIADVDTGIKYLETINH